MKIIYYRSFKVVKVAIGLNDDDDDTTTQKGKSRSKGNRAPGLNQPRNQPRNQPWFE